MITAGLQKVLYSLFYSAVIAVTGYVIDAQAINRDLERKLSDITKEKQFQKDQTVFENSIVCRVDSTMEVRLENYTPTYSYSDVSDEMMFLLDSSFHDMKLYVKRQNRIQDNRFEEYFIMDKNIDSTFKLIIYRLDNGKYIPIRTMPLTAKELNTFNE